MVGGSRLRREISGLRRGCGVGDDLELGGFERHMVDVRRTY